MTMFENEKEGMQHHSVTIMLKMYAGKLTKEQEIGIFWRLAGKAGSLVHSDQEKPYMFYFKKANDDGLYSLNISSIDPAIIDAYLENAREVIEAGEAVDVQGLKVRPVDAFPVRDLDYIGESVCLATETGCTVCKRIRTKEGRKSRYYLNPGKEADIPGWKSVVARKLAERAKLFMDVDIPQESIAIEILGTGNREFVNYKSAKLPTDKVQVEIAAPSPVIFAAIYGGIGSHTGAGFGAVRVFKKQAKRRDAV